MRHHYISILNKFYKYILWLSIITVSYHYDQSERSFKSHTSLVEGFAYRGFLESLNSETFHKYDIRLGIDYGPNLIGLACTNILGKLDVVPKC